MADNPSGQSCATCAYFKDGACRLNPPAVLLAPLGNGAAEVRSQFPAVDDDDWCGEWKAPA